MIVKSDTTFTYNPHDADFRRCAWLKYKIDVGEGDKIDMEQVNELVNEFPYMLGYQIGMDGDDFRMLKRTLFVFYKRVFHQDNNVKAI